VEVYRGKATDVRRIGRELSVRYVLEGSIQREGNRIRVNAQLVDAGNGAHLWSQRWDSDATDIFAVQTQVAEHTASVIAGSDLLLADMQAAARRKRPEDLQAYDLTIMAYDSFLKGTEADTQKGVELTDEGDPARPGFRPRLYSEGLAAAGSRQISQELERGVGRNGEPGARRAPPRPL